MTDVFIPYGENRAETAGWLLGVSEGFGLDPRLVRTTYNGFLISDELADALAQVTAAQLDEEENTEVLQASDGAADIATDGESEEIIEDEEDEAPFDPADHTVAGVKDFVLQYPGTAEAVAELEEGGKNRPSLIEWLKTQNDSSDEQVAEDGAPEKELI